MKKCLLLSKFALKFPNSLPPPNAKGLEFFRSFLRIFLNTGDFYFMVGIVNFSGFCVEMGVSIPGIITFIVGDLVIMRDI